MKNRIRQNTQNSQYAQEFYNIAMNNYSVVGRAAAESGNAPEAKSLLQEMFELAKRHGQELPKTYYQLNSLVAGQR